MLRRTLSSVIILNILRGDAILAHGAKLISHTDIPVVHSR